MKITSIPITLIFIVIITGCVPYDYNFEDYKNKVVIDGWIENGKFPIVLLSSSAGYFSEVDSNTIRNYVITSARVEVSDGENSEVLTLKPNDAYFPPYLYQGTEIKGEVGKTYSIKVNYNGQEITAETSIPKPVTLDSVYFKLDAPHDSLGFIWVKFTDNPDEKNYYRTLTRIQSKEEIYYATYIPNFNDNYFNGQAIEVALYQGNKSSLQLQDQIHFQLGDTVSLKFTSIDKASYNFWNTFNREVINAGNPFAAANSRVISNVNGGLGIWCGYGANYYRIIAK